MDSDTLDSVEELPGMTRWERIIKEEQPRWIGEHVGNIALSPPESTFDTIDIAPHKSHNTTLLALLCHD